jgi:hypothetical protein
MTLNDQARDRSEREAARQAVLERVEEQLLAREPVEVGVRVPETDVVERLLAVELLVAGLQVDLCVAARTADGVEVAVVDVDVDAVQLVDDQLEPVEVDSDDVVDGNVREVCDRVERSLLAADRPRLVDAAVRTRHVGAVAIDRHLEVARERHERQRVVRRVAADEHDRVGARLLAQRRIGALAGVVADDQRRRRLRR